MKITLDTNILVSAFISKQGQPAAILELILTFPEIELILSEQILAEFKEVMSRQEVKKRFEYTSKDIDQFVDALRDASTITKPSSNFNVVKDDPKDDIIINTAYDGKADYIVSGDTHLQSLKRFRTILIVKPRSMLSIIKRRFGELIIPKEKLD